jgi:hypothetical protein
MLTLAPPSSELRLGLGSATFLAFFLFGCSESRSASTATAQSAAAATTTVEVSPSTSASAASPVIPVSGPVCGENTEVAIFTSPRLPWRGEPLRVMVVSERPLDGELVVHGPNQAKPITSKDRHGGAPYWWTLDVPTPAAGSWSIALEPDAACEGKTAPLKKNVRVLKGKPGPMVARKKKKTPNAATAAKAPAGAPSTTTLTSTAPAPAPATAAPTASANPSPASSAAPGANPPASAAGSADPPKPLEEVWSLRATWDRATENLYSAWIEKLFDAPLDEQPSWPALHEVLRDRSRNFLFDYLGADEDQSGLVIRPDCADLPYFLRAYFAYKLGLPFGYSKCSRGGGGAAPVCGDWANNLETPIAGKTDDSVTTFGSFLRYTIADTVHSGSGRVAFADDDTDYYPVALRVDTLRPGTVFADPYGHVLVIARRVPQTASQAGILLAVDGQPDGTVARKRFWRGNFLFAIDPALGGAGFKRFRPVVRAREGGLRRLTNSEIAKSATYGDFSLEQYQAGVDGFYDKMDDVLSPAPLDPRRAMLEKIDALEEQVKTRVNSVENGRKFSLTDKTADMPDDAAIFETTGSWEDFSTPSRDLRLLIAIDIVKGFPEQLARRPERYAMPAGKSPTEVRGELQALLDAELKGRRFTYTRSDGSPFSLSLADVIARAPLLEMAYNPNECVELRWGATPGSDEAAPCKRHAPSEQVAKMQSYRAWFHERRRPPRP